MDKRRITTFGKYLVERMLPRGMRATSMTTARIARAPTGHWCHPRNACPGERRRRRPRWPPDGCARWLIPRGGFLILRTIFVDEMSWVALGSNKSPSCC